MSMLETKATTPEEERIMKIDGGVVIEKAKRTSCRFLPNITSSEARCQVEREINAPSHVLTNTNVYEQP